MDIYGGTTVVPVDNLNCTPQCCGLLDQEEPGIYSTLHEYASTKTKVTTCDPASKIARLMVKKTTSDSSDSTKYSWKGQTE